MILDDLLGPLSLTPSRMSRRILSALLGRSPDAAASPADGDGGGGEAQEPVTRDSREPYSIRCGLSAFDAFALCFSISSAASLLFTASRPPCARAGVQAYGNQQGSRASPSIEHREAALAGHVLGARRHASELRRPAERIARVLRGGRMHERGASHSSSSKVPDEERLSLKTSLRGPFGSAPAAR